MDQSNKKRRSPVSLGFICTILLIAGVIGVNLPKTIHSGPSRISTCINNLRLLDAAKQMWALENNKTNSDIPTREDIRSFLYRGGTELPYCPSGGTYTLGVMSNKPTCSYPGHVLR